MRPDCARAVRVLEFVTAEEASLEAFLSVSERSPRQRHLERYLASLLERRSTRAAWCLVGLDGGVPVARAALWALPDHRVPTDVVLIEAEWSDPEQAAGRSLLARAAEVAAAHGARELTHHVDSPPGPPQYQENPDARIRLLAEAGYAPVRDGLRWTYSHSSSQEPRRRARLLFRSLNDVGEEAFVASIASTYEGTRDSWINSNIEERGVLGAARADFRDYQGLDHLPEWWELAYADDGALAGVIMAARNQRQAIVAYVGVVPEQRGRGLAVELVRRSTEHLRASGAEEIGGDCDGDNVAMVKAFERAGFERVARRRSYRRKITS